MTVTSDHKGYDALRENILEYTCLETGICPPMIIDAFGRDDFLPAQEAVPEQPEKWSMDEFNDYFGDLDALGYSRGKGKGKGEGKKGKDKSWGKQNTRNQLAPRPVAGKCNSCDEVGHNWFECPKLAAKFGKGRGKGAASLEEGQEGLLGNGLDMGGLDAGCLDYSSEWYPECSQLDALDEEGFSASDVDLDADSESSGSTSSSDESIARREAHQAMVCSTQLGTDSEGFRTPNRFVQTSELSAPPLSRTHCRPTSESRLPTTLHPTRLKSHEQQHRVSWPTLPAGLP